VGRQCQATLCGPDASLEDRCVSLC
jgi:hypothetical protein